MKRILSIVLFAGIAQSISGAVVSHTGKYFAVTETDRSYRVGRESLDSTLKNVNKANMAMFMKRGRISAHKTNDGSYVLRGHVNGLGGGPMLASFAYWCTKSLCWGGVATAGGAVIVSGVGAGVALAGGGTAALTAGGMATAGAGLVVDGAIAATGVATGGATIVAGGLGATASGIAIATEGTVALASASGSLGLIGGIEALALAAYAGALALPTP
jgi:hypothetical protein